jgi:predicted transcriptional regulator
MVLNLDPELETALSALARQRGVPPEVLALQALRERFLAGTRADGSQDEWVRRLRQVATDCGLALSDAAVSSEGLYE